MKSITKPIINYFRKKRARQSISFKTAFVVVVLIHVAAYCGLSFWSKHKAVSTKANIKSIEYAESKEVWPTDNMRPQIKAKPKLAAAPSVKPVVKTTNEAIKAVKNPTPKSTSTHDVGLLARQSIKPIDDPVKVTPPTHSPKLITSTTLPLPTPQSTPVVASVKLIKKPTELPKLQKTSSFSQEFDKTLNQLAQDIAKDVALESYYTIQTGENLYIIAHKTQTSYHSIMIANNIKDPRELRVGQILKIPHKRDI